MTRSLSRLLATAVAAVALTTLTSLLPAADTTGAPGAGADQTKNLVGVDESTGKDIRAMLSRLIDDGFKRDGFDDLVGYLSKADRDRLGKVSDMKVDDLNGKIDQFRKDFKDKYNQDFDLKAEHLKDVGVYQGSDKNHALVIVNLMGKDMKGDMKAGADHLRDAGKDLKDTAKNVGETIGAAAGGGGRSVMLHLVNEGTVMNAWRVEIPSTMTAQQLKDSVLHHITLLDDAKGKWPDDVNKAYHASAQHLLEALTTSPIASEK